MALQYFNVSAIKFTIESLWYQPGCFIPHLKVKGTSLNFNGELKSALLQSSLTSFCLSFNSHFAPFALATDFGDIRFSKLKERGIKCVVFDKDNTLTAPYQSLWFNGRLKDCMDDCKGEFGTTNVAICSNTAGSLRDKTKNNYAEAEALQVILGIKVIKHDLNKPNTPISEIIEHFNANRRQEIGDYHELLPQEIAIIGDRLVGDILWGNSQGMMTIKTDPLTLEGENWAVRWVRLKLNFSLCE